MKKEYKSCQFGIGEKVCLSLSNPGYSGTIGGILHPSALKIFHKPEEVEGCLDHWAKISKQTKEDILSKPVYLVIFDQPKVIPQKNADNAIIGGGSKFISVFTFSDDIKTYESFWAEEEKKIKKIK